MSWSHPQAGYARGLHRDGGGRALSYGLADRGLRAFLAQQIDLSLLLRDQGIDLGGFAVKEVGDSWLFVKWRKSGSDDLAASLTEVIER